jgi:aromatic ring-opening dioxygenase LigB subunit
VFVLCNYFAIVPIVIVFIIKEQGRVLGSWIQQRKERIAIAISGDLAHTHRPDGVFLIDRGAILIVVFSVLLLGLFPAVTGKGPYGYSSTAQPFDESILHWVESLKTEELTEKVLLVEEELGSRQSHSGRQESYSPLH